MKHLLRGNIDGLRHGPALALYAALTFSAFYTLPVHAATATVKLTDQEMFEPKIVTVHIGDTVKWVNSSAAVHTVTDDPKLAAKAADSSLPDGVQAFNSGFLKADQTYVHGFKVAGTYRYFCILHEGMGMVGTVVVKP